MALSDLSFKLYTDSALTTPFSGLLQLIHQSNFSDNPQDFELWFGSTVSANQLQANSDPGVDQITLSVVDLLPVWQAAHVYTLGTLRQPIASNGMKYKVTTAGTSGGTEPTWPITGPGSSTVTDGSVTWTFVGAHHPTTEITLALTSVALATNTPGAPLDLGVTILGGVANAKTIWLRKVNSVATPGDNTGYPEHGVNINEVIETVI